MITVYEHFPLIQSLLERYDIPLECLELTPDVQAWCNARGVAEENPFRAAKCFAHPDSCHIVLREMQTEAMIGSAKASMELDGFEVEVARLNTDEIYLAHLVLHEIACFVLQSTEQKVRDEWAFLELAKNAA